MNYRAQIVKNLQVPMASSNNIYSHGHQSITLIWQKEIRLKIGIITLSFFFVQGPSIESAYTKTLKILLPARKCKVKYLNVEKLIDHKIEFISVFGSRTLVVFEHILSC